MRKKKNTPSAPAADKSRRFPAADAAVYFLCGAGIAVCLWLFFTDLNKSLVQLDKTPIATISFKYKAAQRRITDRVLWDRLQQHSPVYAGDLIRTADLSEATVYFPGRAEIDLLENSIIQVFPERIDLAWGDVSLAAELKGVIITCGGNTLDIVPGTVATISSGEEGFSLNVIEGTVRLDSGSGFTDIPAGTALILDSRGTALVRSCAVPVSPLPQAKYLVQENAFVHFSWNTLNYQSGEKTRLEVAEDRRFSKPVLKTDIDGSETTVSLEAGKWWWRVYPAESRTLPAGIKLSLIDAVPPAPISPSGDALIRYNTRLPEIRFIWSETPEASSYIVEVSADAAFTLPVIQTQVQRSFLNSRLEAGRWYWRVRPVFSGSLTGTVNDSGTASFIIEQTGELAAPLLNAPPDGSFFSILPERQNAYFSWKREPEAAAYTIYISKNPDVSGPVISETVQQNYLMYGSGETTLTEGVYYWGVTRTNSAGSVSPLSRIFSFTAGVNPPPVRVPAASTTAPAAAEILPPERPAPPPLPPAVPVPVSPRNAHVFGAKEILNLERIDFRWTETTGAEAYIFTLYKTGPDNTRREIVRTRQRQTFCSVYLQQLDTGTFMWQVEAVQRAGGIERSSAPGQSSFTIDIPLPGEIKFYDPGPLYGN
ncbi:MAG: hypothetical protein LBK77_05925 [Spirochaetaceae bacterium]|jgi:hypothetical protein|nr:hypothetical protein [Spirochaetaceae bacterium]